jgi:hypothetical protein
VVIRLACFIETARGRFQVGTVRASRAANVFLRGVGGFSLAPTVRRGRAGSCPNFVREALEIGPQSFPNTRLIASFMTCG